MTALDTEPLAWDPLDEKYKVDPHPIWKRLRDEQPLYYNEEHDFYAVSRFAEVDAFSRDPKTFCSSHGTVMEMITAEPAEMEIMIFMDPPEHTRYRRLVSKAFTPRRMMLLEDDIRTLCIGILDGLVGRSSFDYVQDFGARVPAYVIAALLGVPPEDRDMVRGWIDETFHLDPEKGMYNERSFVAMGKLREYFGSELADRATHPRDDMFTDLVNGEINEDGELRRLTTEQAVNFAMLIGSAGTETVARLLGWAALTLDDNPEQRGRARRRLQVHSQLRGGAPALRGAVTGAEPLVHGRRGRIRADPAGALEGRDDHGLGRSRRADLSRRRPLRYPPQLRPPSVFRLRHPLLPGRGAGPDGGAHRARGDAQALSGVVGAAGRGGAALHQHRPGLLEASDLGLSQAGVRSMLWTSSRWATGTSRRRRAP